MFKNLNLTQYFIAIVFAFGLIGLQPLFASSLSDGFSTSSDGNLSSFAQSADYSGYTAPENYVGMALNGLFSVLGIIAIGLIFYSGFVWMTARGNDTKVSKAKDNLTEALIGLLILIGAYALTTFLFKVFS